MVSIIENIKELKKILIDENKENGIDIYFYNYINKIENYTDINIPRSSRELAICGYCKKQVDYEVINSIVSMPILKGINYKNNIFELIGISLLSNEKLNFKDDIDEKFRNTSIENKYLIYKVYPNYLKNLAHDIEGVDEIKAKIIMNIIYNKMIYPNSNDCYEFFKEARDIKDFIIMEDLYKKIVSIDIQQSGEPKDVIIKILKEFPNAIKSITTKRRKNHNCFEIKDEYDVQDILYVILKSIYPKMLPEENTPKVGGKTERTDFIFNEFGIILEIKMIKENDNDEREFVKQIKIDIESYYRSNPKYIIFFIYDPQDKTQDKYNFSDLNGKTKKKMKQENMNLKL